MSARAPVEPGVVERAVPADEHRGEADEGVQQGDELRHPGHLDDPRPPEADRAADEHRDHEQRQPERRLRLPQASATVSQTVATEGDRHADDAEA